jgi:hypothetical protein
MSRLGEEGVILVLAWQVLGAPFVCHQLGRGKFELLFLLFAAFIEPTTLPTAYKHLDVSACGRAYDL